MKRRTPTSVRLYPDVHTHLQELAKRAGRTNSQIIERCIEEQWAKVAPPPPLAAAIVNARKGRKAGKRGSTSTTRARASSGRKSKRAA